MLEELTVQATQALLVLFLIMLAFIVIAAVTVTKAYKKA
jgi:hypothetical protein